MLDSAASDSASPEDAPPRKRRTQAERRAATRAALLDATLAVLVEQGYSRLTTTQVVARAGVTRGAQAHYFATKGDLVVQALTHLPDRLVAEMVAQPLRNLGDELEQYTLILDRLWEVYAGPLSDALLELFVASRTDADLRDHLLAFDTQVASPLSRSSRAVTPALLEREDFKPLMTTAIATIRGLWLLRAVASERQIRRVWTFARAQLLAGFPHSA